MDQFETCMKYDANGIPILSALEIEERTEKFLGLFQPQCLTERETRAPQHPKFV